MQKCFHETFTVVFLLILIDLKKITNEMAFHKRKIISDLLILHNVFV